MSDDKRTTTEIEAGPSTWMLTLTITLIILRATGHIDWYWVWVLAPAWIPGAVLLIWGAVIFVLSSRSKGDDSDQHDASDQ